MRALAVRSAAHVAFAEARLSRLPGRNAILVYLSLFEREVAILTDLGIDTDRLEPAWSTAVSRVRVALRFADWGRTLEALRGLGTGAGERVPVLRRRRERAAG